MVFAEHYIEGERTCGTYSEPPDLCPVGQGETATGVLRRIVRHELIGKAEPAPQAGRFERVEPELLRQVERGHSDKQVLGQAFGSRERQRSSSVTDLCLDGNTKKQA